MLRRGSRGDDVRALQTALNKSGAGLTVDGVFGPATEQALREYQKRSNLKVDGVAGSATLGSLGIESGGTGGNKPDFTPDTDVTRFQGLPGKPDMWKDSDTGTWYVVYYIPGTEPPVPMLYSVPAEDELDVHFGASDPKPDKTLTSAQIKSTGGVIWGSTQDIPKEEKDPWAGWMNRMDRLAETQPFLADPEVFAIYAAAHLEGRTPEKWELEGTDWWQSRNTAQQERAWLSMRSPEEAKKQAEQNYIAVYDRFRNLGIQEPAEEVVSYMADRYTAGDWSEQYLDEQMSALFAGNAALPLDAGLQDVIDEGDIVLEDPVLKVTAVQDMYREWLGPVFPPSEEQVQSWAARLRDDEESGRDALEQDLRAQRESLYPQYDPSLTYEDIASPWRGFVTNTWGVATPDETEDYFQRLIKLNDTTEGGKLLRGEGLRRGVDKVEQDALAGITDNSTRVKRGY